MKRGRTLSMLILGVVAATAFAGCTLRETAHYKVTLGNGVYATIFEKPTNQIIQIRRLCGAQQYEPPTAADPTRCAARILRDNVRFEGWGAAEWNDALWYHVIPDMQGNLNAIEPTVGDLNDPDNRCLGLHKSWNGDLNWFDRDITHQDCLDGRGFDP